MSASATETTALPAPKWTRLPTPADWIRSAFQLPSVGAARCAPKRDELSETETASKGRGDARLRPGDDVLVGFANGKRDDSGRRPLAVKRADDVHAFREVEIDEHDVG